MKELISVVRRTKDSVAEQEMPIEEFPFSLVMREGEFDGVEIILTQKDVKELIKKLQGAECEYQDEVRKAKREKYKAMRSDA